MVGRIADNLRKTAPGLTDSDRRHLVIIPLIFLVRGSHSLPTLVVLSVHRQPTVPIRVTVTTRLRSSIHLTPPGSRQNTHNRARRAAGDPSPGTDRSLSGECSETLQH